MINLHDKYLNKDLKCFQSNDSEFFSEQKAVENTVIQILLTADKVRVYPDKHFILHSDEKKNVIRNNVLFLEPFYQVVQATSHLENLDDFFSCSVQDKALFYFYLYHSCMLDSFVRYRELAYSNIASSINKISKFDESKGVEELKREYTIPYFVNQVLENYEYDELLLERTNNSERTWEHVKYSDEIQSAQTNASKVLRANALAYRNDENCYIYNDLVISWYCEKERYSYSFPVANNDLAYTILKHFRPFNTALQQINDDSIDLITRVKKIVTQHQKLNKYFKSINCSTTQKANKYTAEKLVYNHQLEKNYYVEFIPQLIKLRELLVNDISYESGADELIDRLLLASIHLPDSYYRFDLLKWILKVFLEIEFDEEISSFVKAPEQLDTQKIERTIDWMNYFTHVYVPTVEKLFINGLFDSYWELLQGINCEYTQRDVFNIIYSDLWEHLSSVEAPLFRNNIVSSQQKNQQALLDFFSDCNSKGKNADRLSDNKVARLSFVSFTGEPFDFENGTSQISIKSHTKFIETLFSSCFNDITYLTHNNLKFVPEYFGLVNNAGFPFYTPDQKDTEKLRDIFDSFIRQNSMACRYHVEESISHSPDSKKS